MIMKLARCHNRVILLLATMQAVTTVTAFTPSSSNIMRRTQYVSSSNLQMSKSLEALAKEGAWTAYLDEETTGLVYYFNSETGESSWDPPTATFPEVKMSKRKEQQMSSVRQEYNENRVGFEEATQSGSARLDESEQGNAGGIFGNLFAPKPKVEPIVLEEPAPEESQVVEKTTEPNWFGGFFGVKNDAPQQNEDETYDQSQFEDAVAFVEEEYYDQTQFEDAVAVSDGSEAVPEKKSFVDDIMAFASFPATTTKKEEAGAVSESLKIQVGSKILPHPQKVSWGGEDALFVSGRSFGVFDGVSGAEKLDGVPLYSNTLAQQLKSEVGTGGLQVDELKKKLLSAAEYADVSATGASTAIVASIGEDDVMRSLCLGDSVLMVIRNGSVFSRTKETLHYFDCPYQLSEDSPDRPRDGTVLSTKLLSDDVIVAGSDGVFDNLDDAAIVKIVTDESNKLKPTLIAQKIIAESRKVSKDPKAPTPYAKQAKRNRYANYSSGLGGKIDDISCVVVKMG